LVVGDDFIYSARRLEDEELLLDFIIGGITKDCAKTTKTKNSVGLYSLPDHVYKWI
jgi:hypothetical protein